MAIALIPSDGICKLRLLADVNLLENGVVRGGACPIGI